MKLDRQIHLDSVAGIMILYMVYGHLCCWVPETKQLPILPKLFFLFMPWFFFKSGMFYRKKCIMEVAVVGWKKLIVPYIFFSFVGQIIISFVYFLNGATDWGSFVINPMRILLYNGAVPGNSPLWFLLTLFFVRIIYNVVPNKRGWQIVFTALSGLLAYALFSVNYSGYYWIANTLLGLFFYGMGHVLSTKQYVPWVSYMATAIYVICVLLVPTFVDFRTNTMGSGNYLAFMLASTGGIVMFNSFFRKLTYSINTPPSLLAFFGRHSMAYLVMHRCLILFMEIILTHILNIQDSKWLFAIYAVAVLILCPFLEFILVKCRLGWTLGRDK